MSNNVRTYLKNGELILIKPVNIAYALARHEFFVELSQAQTGIIHTIDEIDYHVDESQEQITDFVKNNRGLWLLAFNQDNKIIAEIDITRKKLSRVSHNGLLTIGVLKNYQNLGLGSYMLNLALTWAPQAGLRRIELFVFASNIHAQKLYEKFNFVTEGVRKNYICHHDNSYEDDYMMAKYFS